MDIHVISNLLFVWLLKLGIPSAHDKKSKKKNKRKQLKKSNGDDSDISSFENVIAPQPIKKPKLVSLTSLSSA